MTQKAFDSIQLNIIWTFNFFLRTPGMATSPTDTLSLSSPAVLDTSALLRSDGMDGGGGVTVARGWTISWPGLGKTLRR